MSLDQDNVIQDEIAAKARRAAARASAGGNVAKAAFLSTIQGARTPGEKAVVFGSLLGFIAFFLPWVTVFGTAAATGLFIALHLSLWLWLYPLSMLFCFGASWMLLAGNAKKRILTARWFILIGAFWLAPTLATITNELSGAAGFGLYITAIASAAILVGGLLQISSYLKD